ncbi:MAG: HEAT repeat domain-containing protein [Bryobacterales bacterium]|nr:HEAT repeat domain-containing protein [Bryobacterales bacterium]
MRLPAFILLIGFVCLAQSTVKDRVKGVRSLGDQGAGAIPQIVPYLKDESYEVRREAVDAIAELGTSAALDPLQSALKDEDPEVRIPAIAGLTNFYLPGYIDRGWGARFRKVGRGLKGKFTDTNTQIIDASIQVRPEIIEALGKIVRDDPDVNVRAYAARSLGILRGKAAVPDLLAALKNKDKDTTVIYESLVALQKIRDTQSADGVLFLLTDLNERVQIAAIETVGILRYKESVPRLKEALERTKSNKVKRVALGSLAMIPDEASRPLYETYLNDRDEGLRASAAEGIGRLKNPADLPKVEKLYAEEKKKTAQLSLAFAAVLLGKRELAQFSPLDYLVNTLNNSSWSGVAAPLLEELTRDKGVRESLYTGMAQRTAAEKMELARILSVSGDAATIPVLEQLSRDPDNQVGLAATRALRVLRGRV